MTWSKALRLMLGCYTTLLTLYYGGAKEFVYDRVVHPVEFFLRNRAGLSPQLDSRIKIYAVDHKTMAEVRLESFPIEDWILLFRALAKAQPEAIFIDKTFPLPLSPSIESRKRLADAISSGPPVTAGAFFVPSRIQAFPEISLAGPAYDLRRMGAAAQGLRGGSGEEDLTWLKSDPGFIYGPEPNLLYAFRQIGHTNYEENGYIKPLLRVGRDTAIPFWSLFVENGLSIDLGTLKINRHSIPVDERGRILVNLASPDSYWKRTYSIVSLLKKARAGEPLEDIHPGDLVLILSEMYQGGTAFKSTPAGTMPGAFLMVEVMNSALSGSWLRPIGGEPLLLFLFCALATILATALKPLAFCFTLLGLEVLTVGAGFYAFASLNTLIPWAFPAVGLLCNGLLIFAERARVTESRSRRLQLSLEGMIDPTKLKRLLRNPAGLRMEPNHQILTIVFIDIVGFSLTAESESPAAVFKHLRELLSSVTEIVHECGGIIDKSLGDGLLCYFGYRYGDTSELDSNHAEQALRCAARIQREVLERNLLAYHAGCPIYPLRIGMNTGEVYVGDLGGAQRIEFTVIGHSVNYAQRLESACENHRILCGAATRDKAIQVAEWGQRLTSHRSSPGFAGEAVAV